MRPHETICAILVLAHALLADGIMNRWGCTVFWMVTILAYTLALVLWWWRESGKEDSF